MGIQYFNERGNRLKVEQWKANQLQLLKSKQEETLLLIKDRANRNQGALKGQVYVLRALYGLKSEIKKYLKRFEGDMARILRKDSDSVASNDPYCVADVTIAVRFAMDPAVGGLHLVKMQTKQNIMGFYNPIPPFRKESDTPVLCLVYVLNSQDPARLTNDAIHVDYYSDQSEVKLLIPSNEAL